MDRNVFHVHVKEPELYNIIYLPGGPLGCYVSRWTQGRRLVLMVTYSDLFTFVIMLCAVITLVLTFFNHKK